MARLQAEEMAPEVVVVTSKGVHRLKELRRLGKLTHEQEVEKVTLLELFNCSELSFPFDLREVERKVETPEMTYNEAKEQVSRALDALEVEGYTTRMTSEQLDEIRRMEDS